MNIDLLLSAVIYGLSIGGIFFLVSIGLSIGFGLMRVVNLEQMLYYTFSAYITYTMVKLTGQFWLGLLFGIFIASMLGLIVETQLLRRVYGKEMIFTMIVTFSVFLIGIGIIQIIWGLDPKPLASPIKKILNLFGLKIPLYRLIIIVVAIATYLMVQMFLQRTIIGKAIRAGIENPDNLQGLGINIYRIFTITFVIASALAGLGGALNAPLVMVGPYMGFDMLLYAFITVILGGLGSVKGTLISALIVGQVISVGGTIWSPLSFVAPFIVMFLVILIKPTGLFGIKGIM